MHCASRGALFVRTRQSKAHYSSREISGAGPDTGPLPRGKGDDEGGDITNKAKTLLEEVDEADAVGAGGRPSSARGH